MKKKAAYLPATDYALAALGAHIGAARRDLGWTASNLAERLGVSPQLVARIERGAPTCAIGTVLEAAVLCAVPLFAIDPGDVVAMARLSENCRLRLALLPSRVRRRTVDVDNNF